jgi:hypothetical protein
MEKITLKSLINDTARLFLSELEALPRNPDGAAICEEVKYSTEAIKYPQYLGSANGVAG